MKVTINDLKSIGWYEIFGIDCYTSTFEEGRYLFRIIELEK